MNQINETKISGFFDNNNYELIFTSQSNLNTDIDDFITYLDSLYILSSQIYRSKKDKAPPAGANLTNDDINDLFIDLKLIYISKIVNNVLNTFLSIYDKRAIDTSFKEIDKENILKKFWNKIQPQSYKSSTFQDKTSNLSEWACNFSKVDLTKKSNELKVSEDYLKVIQELNDIFKKCYEKESTVSNQIKTNSKYKDKSVGKSSGITLHFEDYNLSFLNFRSDLLSKQSSWPPIFKKDFKVIPKTEASQGKATIFNIPDKIEISDESIQKFIQDINLLYKLNKQVIYDEDRKNLEILKLRSKATDEYTKDTLLAPEKEAIRKQATNKFDTDKINKNINEIYEKSPSLKNLTNDEILIILENTLNIFVYPGKQIIKTFRDYSKNILKITDTGESVTSNPTIFENNIKVLINILNKLKLKNIEWGEGDDKEIYKFIPNYFSFKMLNQIEKKIYILEVNLNLEYSIINTYLKFIINFNSDDPTIKNIKNYNFKITDSIPDSKISDGNIYLPPLIYSNTNADPKDISCCYVLVTEDDIRTFNKNNPTIQNKEIFTDLKIIDKLIKQISKNKEDNKYRYEDPNAFKKDIELIASIFFSPHPITNKYIGFITKHFSKNNLIYYQNKPYHIINYDIENIPENNNFDLIESKKNGTQEIGKIYKINITLTVSNGEKPLNLARSISASCPAKANKLNTTYKNITNNIGILKNFGKPDKLKKRWYIKDGYLQKADDSDSQSGGKKTKKKYLHINMKKRKYTKKKLRKVKKLKKLNKKTKKMIKRKKYTRRKMKYRAGVNSTGQTNKDFSNSSTAETGKPKTPSPPIPSRQSTQYDENGYRLDSQGWHADSEFQCFGCESGTDFGYHCPACERETDLRHRR